MRSAPPPNNALTLRQGPGPLDDVKLQKLWLATQRREWRSLSVVAAAKEVDAMEVATLLAKIAWSYRGQPTAVLDFRDLTLRMVEYQIRELADQMEHGERVIIALRSITENPTTIAVATMTDAAVLCVRLGSPIATATQTIDEIGRDRFLGTILVKGKKA